MLNIKIIGCGGIGGCLIPTLSKMMAFSGKECSITFIDGDAYEDRNAERQVFSRIGKKAEVTKDDVEARFGEKIEVFNHNDYITEENAVKYIRESDVVFACVDNHTTRKLISNRASELNDVLVISGGNDLLWGDVLVYFRKNGIALTDPFTKLEEIEVPEDKHPLVVLREAGCDKKALEGAPQLLVTNNLIAAHMLCVFQAYLSDELESLKTQMIYLDVISNRSRVIENGTR